MNPEDLDRALQIAKLKALIEDMANAEKAVPLPVALLTISEGVLALLEERDEFEAAAEAKPARRR